MTEQEINLAIAEECGIKCEGCGGTGIRKKFGADEYSKIRATHEEWIQRWPLNEPDLKCNHELILKYTTSLEAMHQAEKTLNQSQYWQYADVTLKAVVWKNGAPGTAYQCATAMQRAEAFLRVKGKWRD